MRLTHVRVEGCGRFVEPVIVADLKPGLNVLAAPNEAGKSTLFKAVRACIFKKHTTRDEELRDLCAQGANSPLTVEVGFELGGHRYVARKSFLSSPRASLMKDGKEIAAARAADEEIYNLLGVKPGSGRNVDEGAFGMLWVAQSKSFAPPAIDGDVKNSLEAAIEREVGSLVGGDRARELLKTVAEELGAFYTPSGQVKKSGALGAAQDRVDSLTAETGEARRLLAELERDIDLLEQKRREFARLSDPALEAEDAAKLKAAREEFRLAEEAAVDIQRREQAVTIAAAERDDAARTLKALRETAARIDAAIDARARAVQEAASESARRLEAEGRLQGARARLAALEEADARDANAENHLRNLGAAAAAAAGLPEIERRLELLTQAADDLAATRGAIASIRATPRHVQALDRIDTEIAQLRARLDAAATRLVITPDAGVRDAISVDGASISAPTEIAATQRTIITIAGVGEIVIAPPAQFGETERKRMAELEAMRARAIADAGAGDAAGVVAQAEERARLDSKLAAILARLAALQSGEETAGRDIAGAREKIETVRASIRNTLGEGEAPPDAALIAEKQEALLRKRREAASARKAAQAEADAISDDLNRLAAAVATKKAEEDNLTRQIEGDLGLLPQPERPSRIAAAAASFDKLQRAFETADLALRQARDAAPGAERVAQIADRVKRHETALANRRAELTRIEVAIGELKGRIHTRGGEGLGERLATLVEDLALAQRDLDRVRARAASLALLKETIESCYQEQREQLQAPIRQRLQPFLNDLFPKAELTLDEGFAVQRIVRAGSEESFDRLSDGTREQIAVLVRLALGALLHERGQDLPIILDDALVFCDDDRIELMFDALNRAARTQQVIVLTCRGKSFRTLGGHTLTIASAAAAR